MGIGLYLFDLDGTVIRSFLREGAPRTPENYGEVKLLPGRKDRLDALRDAAHVAFVTNQGGVAFGYQTVDEVLAKMTRVREAVGIERGGPFVCSGPHADPSMSYLFYVAFGHPKGTVELFKTDSDWRKPGAGMILQAMHDYAVEPADTLFVGDMDSDRECAANAGVPYKDAAEFFG